MRLRLRVLTPDGTEFVRSFDGPEVVLGRASDCDLAVPDRAMSRRHARLLKIEGGWWVEDLGSRNGTVLDGIRVLARARLEDGSTIRLGGTVITVESGSGGQAPDEAGSGKHTRYVPATRLLKALEVEARPSTEEENQLAAVAERLKLLHDVHQALAAPWSLRELLTMILDRVFEHLRPEQGAIFLREEDGSYACVASRSDHGEGPSTLYSRSLLREVAEKGMAALVLDARTDSRFASARSLVASGVTSLAAAPLLGPEGPLGMIVVGSRLYVRRFEEDDLELLTSLASVAAMRIRNVRLAQEAAERRRLEREVELARRIQQVLLPEALPTVDGWELYGATTPCRGASGDMFKVVERAGPELVFLVADVSGKGIGAALLTASLEALTAVPIHDGYPPGRILGNGNRLLCERTPPEKFATAFLGVLEPATGVLTWSNAGHPPAFIVEPGGEVRRLEATGVPIALFPDSRYPERREVIAPGETLVCYTDGFTEAESGEGEELGVDGLESLARKHREKPVPEFAAALTAELDAFSCGGAFGDDRTLLVVRRLTPAAVPGKR